MIDRGLSVQCIRRRRRLWTSGVAAGALTLAALLLPAYAAAPAQGLGAPAGDIPDAPDQVLQ